MAKKAKGAKSVEALVHEEKRKNIPTAEFQSLAEKIEARDPFEPVTYKRENPLAEGEKRERNDDLDPQIIWRGADLRLSKEQINTLKEGGKIALGEAQLVWRGKDEQDWSDLVVQAPPIYVQEKIHPKHIIEDLKKQTQQRKDKESEEEAPDLFDGFKDFNGLDSEVKTEFYQHDQNWQNRMILGDSLQVMASLAERERLQGKVQCLYFDPPYGIKFNSNWQVSTRAPEAKDGKREGITREAEQVKAFRDTWKDGIHSYLTYLRDRMTVMRDLLTESGSVFVQIGEENVHRVRAVMDEVFGGENFVRLISYVTTAGLGNDVLDKACDYIIWYAKDRKQIKYREIYMLKNNQERGDSLYRFLETKNFVDRPLNLDEKEGKIPLPENSYIYMSDNLTSQSGTEATRFSVKFCHKSYSITKGSWKTNQAGMLRLIKANRIHATEKSINYKRKINDFMVRKNSNLWHDTLIFARSKLYVVQTSYKIIQRCILMTTDPGDLVLDPTCGSGTTATVAEQWGRRWITMDTSRVALALARTRLMSARYPYYYLFDSEEGREKEQKVTGKILPQLPIDNSIPQGFVYERVPHVTLKSIARNVEIDVIWEEWQKILDPLREQINKALGESWEEWEVPREVPREATRCEASEEWSHEVQNWHQEWWQARIARQQEIDKSIAQKADVEYLYDRPYEDKSKVRVAGPFTMESLSPHRVIPSDESETLVNKDVQDFVSVILENLKSAGVHQSDKKDRIEFTSIDGWPGDYIAATGTYEQDDTSKKAAIFIGPEFGSVTLSHIMIAAREAGESGFDVLIACGFNFDAHSSEVNKLGSLPILKAKINPDLHMANDLKNTGTGNLFVVFGEPDIEWNFDERGYIVVKVLGIDVFDPKTNKVRASGKDDIAAWFIDTDYNEESFFVRHAYFMGANDPYKSLKTSLKAEIDGEAWATLYSDISRPFKPPEKGRFAVKVINHFGDEVMKIFTP